MTRYTVPDRVSEMENEIALLKLANAVLRGQVADLLFYLSETDPVFNSDRITPEMVALLKNANRFVDADLAPKAAPFPARALMQRKQHIGLHG